MGIRNYLPRMAKGRKRWNRLTHCHIPKSPSQAKTFQVPEKINKYLTIRAALIYFKILQQGKAPFAPALKINANLNPEVWGDLKSLVKNTHPYISGQ